MKRLPIIRHIRWLYYTWQVRRHYAMWASMGAMPWNYSEDKKALDAIWRGER